MGSDPPDGQMVSQLNIVGLVTVMFSEAAFAVSGTPHRPRIWKLRVVVPMAGPPLVPTGLRVSTARQGVSGKYDSAVCAEASAGIIAATAPANNRSRRVREMILLFFI